METSWKGRGLRFDGARILLEYVYARRNNNITCIHYYSGSSSILARSKRLKNIIIYTNSTDVV